MEISRGSQGCETRHYIKETQTDRSISFNSAHPKSVFKGILKGEVMRSFDNCSKGEDRQVEAERIKEKFLKK